MKKILGISLVAVLTAMPLIAGAAVDTADPGATNANAPEATAAPKYSLVQANSTNDGKFATAGYVKGAYNAAIKAVNKTAVDAKNGANLTDGTVAETKLATEVQTKLNAGASALQAADITTGTEQMANGTISVDGTAVAVKGLGTAAFTDSTAYANTTLSNVTAGSVTTGLINDGAVTTVKLGADAVTNAKLADDAVQTENIVDGNVTKAKLAQGVQDSLGLADSALQAADITTGATNGTIAVDGTDVSVYGLGDAAYSGVQGANNAATYTGTDLTTKGYVDEKVATTTAGMATEAGVVATVNAASATYTPAGTISGTIPAMTDWESQTAANIDATDLSFTGTQATITPTVGSYSSGS